MKQFKVLIFLSSVLVLPASGAAENCAGSDSANTIGTGPAL